MSISADLGRSHHALLSHQVIAPVGGGLLVMVAAGQIRLTVFKMLREPASVRR
jgi:hypothetical protein